MAKPRRAYSTTTNAVAPPLDEKAAYEHAGPSLLAAQPNTAPEDRNKMDGAGWRELSGHLETRLSGMKTWRLSWWQHWALLASYILPRRYQWP